MCAFRSAWPASAVSPLRADVQWPALRISLRISLDLPVQIEALADRLAVDIDREKDEPS
jgi:hypothetical protein